MLFKKKLFLILLFLNTVLIGILFIVPFSKKVMEYVELYSQAFFDPFPEMKLDAGKIQFLDPVPVKLTIGDSVQVICDTLYDEVYFSGCYKNSVFISADSIYLKTENEIKKIDIASLNIENNEKNIEPEKIRAFLEIYANIILQVLTVVSFVLLFLLLLLINTIAAGIGFIVDAFESGKFIFIHLLNISGIFLTVILLLNSALYMLNVLTVKFMSINMVLFYLLVAAVVYYLSKYSRFSI